MEAATTEIDGAIQSLKRTLAPALYRSGFGDIGQVGSISTDTITLLSTESVTNFEVGMVLVASSAQGSAVLRTGSAIIVAVNRSAGTITLDAVANITSLTANDYLFVQGNRQNSATPARLMVSGLEAWLPQTAPTSTPFFGVDRSIDVTRLAGQRLDISAKPIEEGLIDAASLVAREGGKIDTFFMSYAKYAELEKALGTRVQYINLEMNPVVGFRGVEVSGPRGMIRCIPDQNCPADKIFGLQLDMWKLYSLGKAVRVIDTDGLQMLRQANADGVEVRYGFYGNLACRAPGYNITCAV